MRNIKFIAGFLLLLIVVATACRKKAADRSILGGAVTAPVLTTIPMMADTIVLGMDSADNDVIKMSWTAAEWGFPSTPAYNLEVVKSGTDWSKAAIVPLGKLLTYKLTHVELNDLAIAQGITAGSTGELTARIKAFLPGTNQMVYSSNETKSIIRTYIMLKPTLTATVDSTGLLILSADSALKEAIKMNWTEVKWANPSTTNYALEVMEEGGNWKNDATSFDLGQSLTAKFSHKALSKLLIDTWGHAAGDTVTMLSRIKAFVPGTSRVSYSDIIKNYVSPYDVNLVAEKLYVPGDYQGWAPWDASVQVLDEIVKGSGRFSGLIEKTKADGTLSSGDFKLTPAPNFDYDFGDNGSTYTDSLAGSGNIGPKWLGLNGPNFKLKDGTYKLTVDTNAAVRTWSYTLENWAVTGDATPLSWPAGPNGTPGQDQNMRYNQTTKMYEITIDLVAGKSIKFRKNDNWADNYGWPTGQDGDPISLDTPLPGTNNGKNYGITVTGNYFIQLSTENNTILIHKN